MGVACSDDQPATGLALVDHRPDGSVREVSFGHLSEMSTRFANGLHGLGVRPGDRVAVMVEQSTETGVAHLGIHKAGAIVMPLSVLFGPDALRVRLEDAEPRVVVTTPHHLDDIREATDALDVQLVVTGAGGPISFDDVVANGRARLDDPGTGPDTAALLVYTSGTTGAPKGALHGHRTLLGHMPGFELMYDFFGQVGDRMWTPADWAWIGGLLDAVLPAWYHGRPVIAASRRGFDPQWAIDLMERARVRTTFLPPTALKLMRSAHVDGNRLALRSCMSGGEPLGAEMLDWGEQVLGVTINEIYGQTEANLLVGNSHAVWPVVPGSMGRPYPGHDVAVLDSDAKPVAPGELGQIAVRTPDPVAFLGYWNQPDATAQKFNGDWLLTGDMATTDDDGYLWFHARNDDVINSAGYRIGPGEIEEALLGHDGVAMAAVVGVPDDTRGQAVKAFVQLVPDVAPSDELAQQLQQLVRTRVAAHEYPREVEFIDQLPLTTTGKVQRRLLREPPSTG